jgi:hypothetical protein
MNLGFNSICIITYHSNNYKLTLQTPELQHTRPLFSKAIVLVLFTSSSISKAGNSLYIDDLKLRHPRNTTEYHAIYDAHFPTSIYASC